VLNPIKLAKEAKKIVTQGNQRKYYRFRKAPFYGGIATADCVGCNLRCVFCWAQNVVQNPQKFGKFYLPEIVAQKLIQIAKDGKFNKVRISGNEPTIAKEHLFEVLKLIPKELIFILETNGILIGADRNFAKELAQFKNLHVRVSLKGTTENEFEKLTLADGKFFNLQLKALENLKKEGVSCHPALIEIAKEKREELLQKLKKIDPSFELEIEPLILYPKVKKNLKKMLNF
jgi:uncharacterized Fe-S cluster-containing radical SAM superfamily protein